MAGRGTTKFSLPEYMGHVRKCIADTSILMRIKWFQGVEQLFQQVYLYIYNTKLYYNYKMC